jgi:hypothetical protein
MKIIITYFIGVNVCQYLLTFFLIFTKTGKDSNYYSFCIGRNFVKLNFCAHSHIDIRKQKPDMHTGCDSNPQFLIGLIFSNNDYVYNNHPSCIEIIQPG